MHHHRKVVLQVCEGEGEGLGIALAEVGAAVADGVAEGVATGVWDVPWGAEEVGVGLLLVRGLEAEALGRADCEAVAKGAAGVPDADGPGEAEPTTVEVGPSVVLPATVTCIVAVAGPESSTSAQTPATATQATPVSASTRRRARLRCALRRRWARLADRGTRVSAEVLPYETAAGASAPWGPGAVPGVSSADRPQPGQDRAPLR